jgi:hypothetical protein
LIDGDQRRLEHEATKGNEEHEARRTRSRAPDRFVILALRSFVQLRSFVFQTSPTEPVLLHNHPQQRKPVAYALRMGNRLLLT